MVSCLETYSMDARHEMEIRSDYTRNNKYSSTHPDALSTGDRNGKGTGHGGHGHWLPHCTSQLGVFNYSNFDTAISSNPGNDADNQARQISIIRSLYSRHNPYGTIDTTANVLEGQYQVR